MKEEELLRAAIDEDAARHAHHAAWCAVFEAERQRLKLRDLLRSDARLAARYAALKADLAATFARDREACTDAKAAFVLSLVGDA